MIPILLAGAAALLFLGGGKKKSKPSSQGPRPNGNGGEPTPEPGPDEPDPGEPPRPGGLKIIKGHRIPTGPKLGEPWSRCEPPPGSPKGTQAAVSKDGTECMVFWKPGTADVVKQYLQKELDKLPKDKQEELCASDNCEPDPFWPEEVQMCDWIPDPNREAFVKKVVMIMWPQIGTSMLPLPEPDHLGRINSPHFVKYTWSRVSAIFAHDFCGFNPHT